MNEIRRFHSCSRRTRCATPVRAARAAVECLEGRVHLHAGHDHGVAAGAVTVGRVPWATPAWSVSQAPTAVAGAAATAGPAATAGVSAVAPGPIRIDAAGGGLTDAAGRTWMSDRYVTGGNVTTTPYAVGGTVDDPLYYTRRWGVFNYNVPVARGTYTVKLAFADPVYTTAGKRRFNVLAEGKVALNNFDIAAAGGGRAAVTRQFSVAVADGTLNLVFAKVLDNPIVSAIEIVPGAATPTPTATAVTGLTLVNAATDTVVGSLDNGASIDLAALGAKLSVRAETSPGTVGSVTFTLDGQRIKLENAAPYTIAGDVGSDYLPWTPAVGTHTLVVTPYAGANASGAVGQSATVRFAVMNSTPTPNPTPNPTPGAFTKINWTTKAASPIGRAEALSAAVDGQVYVFGGFSGSLGPVTRSDVFDPAVNTWSPIKDLPERTTHAGVAVDGRDVFLVGGYVGKPGQTGYDQTFGTRNVWRYNVDADAWTPFAQLPAAMAGGGAVVVGRDLHYFGGYDLSRKDVNVHLVLSLDNPAAGWRGAAKMLKTVNHLGAVTLGGKVYAVAGQTGTDGGLVTHRDVQIYDPATDTWSAGAPMPAARSHISSATFVVGERIFAIAGESAHGVTTRNVYAYTPATNSWQELTALPTNRFSGVAAAINGKIYYTTGGGNATYEGTPG